MQTMSFLWIELFAKLSLLLQAGQACDVGYDFGPSVDAHTTELRTTLTWWTVEPATKANVYLSTAISTACNSGYFGSQFHSDGLGNSSQSLLFSMWDNPHHVGLQNHSEFPFQVLPAGGNCWRNALDASGKSTGVQCGQPWPKKPNASLNVSLHLGVPYEFKLAMTAQNTSGALWEVSFFDPVSNATISVGKIFFVDVPLNLSTTCRSLGRSVDPPTQGLSSYSFLEYFEAPFDFTTFATWSNITAFEPSGTPHPAPGVSTDCCGHTYGTHPTGDFYDFSQHCVPPACDVLELNMMCGPYLKPPESLLKKDPSCREPTLPFRSTLCWGKGSPISLDECFDKRRRHFAQPHLKVSAVDTIV